ncbi:alpha/beta hydrolase [Pseudonocardia sp. DSM 110487]|uniref:alpha/beta fold hydrolase n=1 Tax=Pseudonocardia sp. DSM 110487 TaxID=2865833 RepID=UPI001C6A65E4|nr:alpha/beta hydrolase [Pseudonocardia sp. DSM 110487]QYN33403.1 alpha/beta hydrolase [Pseudonocardia sp. DSM 110487]
MAEIELSAGTIEYTDTGGSGPVLVFVHGVTVAPSQWRHVVAELSGEYRCVLPHLPLGSHLRPMRPDADLSLRGLAMLIGEFLEKLDLRDVTLVQNDWGGAQVLVAHGGAERVARMVLVACEAFDNYPPGIAGRLLTLTARVPGGLALLTQLLRFRAARRAPGGWGWMSKRPVPDEVMDEWFRPAREQAAVRRDLEAYGRGIPPRDVLLEWAERNRSFGGPVLVVWAAEDRLMPAEHGRRLAALYPQGRLVTIPDSYTLVPEDQPAALTAAIRAFLSETRAAAR